MSAESIAEPKLELGHVLFIDIVGYSKLLINDQTEFLRLLNEAVQGSAQYRSAETQHKLLRLPTGDGMALIFRTTPDAPARCALEVSEQLKVHSQFGVRMGIHSGPVNKVVDVNGRTNVTGAGINLAQRVMDCGDAGHILLSKRVAEDLEQFREWQPNLHDLGPCEVKHGLLLSIVNLYTDAIGNSEPPKKCKASRWKRTPRIVTRHPIKRMFVGSLAVLVLAAVLVWQFRIQSRMKTELAKLRQGVVEYPQIEAQVRGEHSDTNPAAEQEAVYAQLAKQLNVDASVLREKLPQFAAQLKSAPTAGSYERANASYVAKDYTEAERLALQAAADAKKNIPINEKDVVAALQLAGLSAFRAIEYDRAMQHFRDAEKLTDWSRATEEWATLQHNIADLLVAQGKYGEAEKLFTNVIQVQSRALGSEHPDTLDTRHRLIYALTRQTKYAEAETEARNVLKSREKVLGPDHIDTIVSRYNLAEPLVEQGKYGEAEALYREVIRLDEKVFGSEHPRTLSARVGLATVLGDEGKNAEAEPLYREIIRLDEKVYGPEHPNTLNDRQNLATTLQADGKYSEAEKEYRDVIRMDENLIGPEHPDTLYCRNNLADMLDDQGKYAEAEAECRRIIGPEEKVLGADNRLTLNSRGNLALALIAQGKFPEAETEYKDAIGRMERVLGIEHPDILNYASKFAIALSRQNRKAEAIELAKGLEKHARAVLANSPSVQAYEKLARDLEAAKY
jgi:tetratricopeptide (TPR) repeat protein